MVENQVAETTVALGVGLLPHRTDLRPSHDAAPLALGAVTTGDPVVAKPDHTLALLGGLLLPADSPGGEFARRGRVLAEDHAWPAGLLRNQPEAHEPSRRVDVRAALVRPALPPPGPEASANRAALPSPLGD